jgi:hypothetical protein
MTVAVCGSGLYGLTMIAATLMDDAWIVPASTVAVILLWMLQGRVPAWANIYRPMAEGSPLVTHAVPWAPMAVAAAVGTAGLLIALRIVQRQEY